MAEPDAPFVMETICIGGHGIASGYRACAGGRAGRSSPCSSGRDDAARAWGFGYTCRRCRSSAQRLILTAADLLTKYVRWCIRWWTPSGATPPGPSSFLGRRSLRQRPGPGPRYARSPSHSPDQDRTARGDHA